MSRNGKKKKPSSEETPEKLLSEFKKPCVSLVPSLVRSLALCTAQVPIVSDPGSSSHLACTRLPTSLRLSKSAEKGPDDVDDAATQAVTRSCIWNQPMRGCLYDVAHPRAR